MNTHGADSLSQSGARKPKGNKVRARTALEALESRVMLSVTKPGDQSAAGLANAAALNSRPEMAQGSRDLIVVDASLARRGLVPANPSAHTRVVLLNDSTDVLSQITAALQGTGSVRSLHILTHGQAGEIRVGDQTITAATLADRSGEVAKWSHALTDTAAIAIYGCDVAEGASGRAFVQALARRTGATVAASTDLTGAAARGGDWTLEYVAGNNAAENGVHALQFAGFDGLLATFTVAASAGDATHVVGTGASVVDGSLTIASSDTAATYTSATVSIGSNYKLGQDVLALGSAAPAGFSGVFNAATGTLTVSAAGKTAAEFQQAMRKVTYLNTQAGFADLTSRDVTFTFNGVADTKVLAPDLPVDQKIQDRLTDAFGVIDQIGQKIVAANAQPYRNATTDVPIVGERLTDLLYPNSPTLDANGNAVPDLSKSIQPNDIGAYLQLKSTVASYFATSGTAITDLTGLQAALTTYLTGLVQGNQATLQVDASFTKPSAADARRIDLTVTILTAKGDPQALQLEQLSRDLNMKLGAGATVEVGGGADLSFTISLDLAGHVYGNSATTIAAGSVGVNFTRLNAFAGYTVGNTPFDITLGAIRGHVHDASGYVGVTIPVNLGAGGNTRTLSSWQTDGSDYAGFGTMHGSANVVLPITASVGGVSATTSHTKVVLSDTDLFDANQPTYSTVDYGALEYFSNIRIDDVINQVLKVGDLMNSLTGSGDGQFGLYVPTVDDTTLGSLFDFKSLFHDAIGAQVDIYQPTLNTPGRDQLTDYRLPLSSDSTPRAAAWSDLRAGFTFGVVLNETYPVHTVAIAADDTRLKLDDLVTDMNAAFVTAGLDLEASNVKNKISIKATDVSAQRFAVVPVATDAGLQNPTAAPATGSGLTLNTPQYYTVTGSTTGTVTGTSYYTLGTSIAAAAVHAGVLKDRETGVVKVTRLASKTVLGSTRNGVTSADGSGDVYLIESGVSDLRRLGLVAYDTPLGVLESVNSGAARATLPLQADLPASASFNITAGANTFTVNVPDNGRTSILDTLGDIQSSLATAGVGPSTLSARLVDADGNTLGGTPTAGTNYYLQFYLPDGSAWTDYTLSPKSDATAYQVLPLGFLSGDTAARPRPAGLQSFDDFADAALFPGLSVSPVYDATAGTVTLEFTASNDASKTVKAAFDLALKKLGSLSATDANLAFTAVVHSEMSFGLQFEVGPEKPVSLPSGSTLPPTAN